MQTFLPYADFAQSAHALDSKRLGKQRVECKQIYLALTQPDYGWKNHPAVKMWFDFGNHRAATALAVYAMAICNEWRARGFNDSLLPWFEARVPGRESPLWDCEDWFPPWLGNEAFHLSHQSNLVRKDPAYYGPQFPGVPDNLPYIWPSPCQK